MSPTMSSLVYLMPMLVSVVVMSLSEYSSNRFSASSVKMTYGAGVCVARHVSVEVLSRRRGGMAYPTVGAVLGLV